LLTDANGFITAIRPLNEVPGWDVLVTEGRGGTVFHERWFLAQLGARRLLCVSALSDGRLQACMPLIETAEGRMEQNSLSSPYAGPVFGCLDGSAQRVMLMERRMLEAIVRGLQTHYTHVSFSLSPDITDIVPFLRTGFVPEVRFTYVVDVSGQAGQCISRMSARRRNDLRRSRKWGLAVVRDANLELFDVARAVAWAASSSYECATNRLLHEAIAQNRGCAFVALRSGVPVGGLFLVWDRRHSYTILSYFHEDAGRTGASTLLYTEAMSFTREVLKLNSVDLEGSVLPGVEEFYQSFGGKQIGYFRLHWRVDRAESIATDLYDYSRDA
jgi:hypothetical protein